MANAANASSALQAMDKSQHLLDPDQGINPLAASPGPARPSVETAELVQDMTAALKALQSSDEAHRAIVELINFTAKPMVIQAMFSTDAAETAAYVNEIKDIFDQIANISEGSAKAYLDYSTSR